MKSLRTFAIAGIAGAFVAGLIVNPVLAAQPRGSIKKYVQDQTTNSPRSDADNAGSALQVKTGDILKYTVEITNGGDSDMHYTQLTDTLPPGVALATNPATRQISEELGVVRAGQTVTKTYLVKVTADRVDEVIENKACFTGNSQDRQAAQNGCNSAVVKVTSAETPPKPDESKPTPGPTKPEEKKSEPTPPKQTPAKPQQPSTPAPEGKADNSLPTTGPSEVMAASLAVGAGAAGYAGRLFSIRRRK